MPSGEDSRQPGGSSDARFRYRCIRLHRLRRPSRAHGSGPSGGRARPLGRRSSCPPRRRRSVHRGSLDDLNSLRVAAAASDGVIHLAFIHDFSQYENAAKTAQRAVEALGVALEGSERPLVVTSGVLGLPKGSLATEHDTAAPGARFSEQTALPTASRGVRTPVIRLSPTVHGEGDHGFVATLINVARETGASGYIGDGSNEWPAVHRLDAAHLFRLALENAPAGSVLHGVAEQGVQTRDIAEAIGRQLRLPVVSIDPEKAAEHFGWVGRFFALDARTSSALTQDLLGWQPTHPGLIEDLDQGHYFETSSS